MRRIFALAVASVLAVSAVGCSKTTAVIPDNPDPAPASEPGTNENITVDVDDVDDLAEPEKKS